MGTTIYGNQYLKSFRACCVFSNEMKLEELGCMIPDTISVILWISLCGGVFQNTAADLIFFDALEQRAKIAFAETFIALPLD